VLSSVHAFWLRQGISSRTLGSVYHLPVLWRCWAEPCMPCYAPGWYVNSLLTLRTAAIMPSLQLLLRPTHCLLPVLQAHHLQAQHTSAVQPKASQL
jgi:hypothetical protein